MGNYFAKDKQLIILRGLPGCGKSSLAKQLTSHHGVSYSTNDFFMENNVYRFDVSKLKDAHMWNQQRTLVAMKNAEPLVVVDNCNIKKWEAKPYVEMGIKYGYTITFTTVDTPWKFNPTELANKNIHNVTEKMIERMLDQWESDFTVDNVLNSKAPWE
jgi:predicted kinase